MIYRRKKDFYAWHWCMNCSQWPTGPTQWPTGPTSDYEEVTLPYNERPSDGALCDQCQEKENTGDCVKLWRSDKIIKKGGEKV